MKPRHTRKKFNPGQKVVCSRSFLYDGTDFNPGNDFPFDIKDRKQVLKARQLYDMRKLEYIEEYRRLNDITTTTTSTSTTTTSTTSTTTTSTSTTSTTSTSTTSTTTTTTAPPVKPKKNKRKR